MPLCQQGQHMAPEALKEQPQLPHLVLPQRSPCSSPVRGLSGTLPPWEWWLQSRGLCSCVVRPTLACAEPTAVAGT